MNNLISILIPIYKSEDFINRLYNSIKNQTYTNLEIIFINDGSPDNSGSICDSIAKKDSRVKVIHQINQGAAVALNKGLNLSIGEFIMFLDADDWIELNTCELAIKNALDHNADMVFWMNTKEYLNESVPYTLFFPESTIFIGENIIYLRRRMIGLQGKELKIPTQTDAFNAGWGKLYKTDIIKKNNIHWTSTNQVGSSDVLFNAQLMPHIKKAFFLKEYLHHYNKENPNALTKTYNNSLYPKFQNLFDELLHVIEKNYDSNDFKKALDSRIALSTINVVLSLTNKGINSSAYSDIKLMINSDRYKKSFKSLEIKYLPISYKFFFYSCRFKLRIPIYLMGLIMNKLRKG